MKLTVVHQDKEHELDVRALDGDRYEVTAFGKTFTVGATHLPSTLLVERDNNFYELAFDERVRVRGHEIALEVLNAREAAARRMQAAAGGDAGTWEVKSPMPGKVVAVLVKPGDTVAAGQGLIVVEAMKMENELRAPKAGTIATIHVQPGETVVARAVLISSS